jgi:uncharacterized protein (TIGR02246 family)
MSTDISPDAAIALYTRLLEAWNARDARAFAEQFAEHGSAVGYDGSPMNGRAEIRDTLDAIFRHHTPATYVARVREVRELSPGVALVRAAAGMVPPGASVLNPERNAIQTLIAVSEDGAPRIALFQNTPARFDGRPQLAESLSTELAEVVRSGRIVDGD